jgi:hypothetical protein
MYINKHYYMYFFSGAIFNNIFRRLNARKDVNAQIRRVILITSLAWREALESGRGVELVRTLETLNNMAATEVARNVQATSAPLTDDMIRELNRFRRESTIAFLAGLNRQKAQEKEEEEEEEEQDQDKPSTSTGKPKPKNPKKRSPKK